MIIRFDKDRHLSFEPKNFTTLSGLTGLYFISVPSILIPYPVKNSPLIYIGMSESRINSIGNRLKDHCSGRSMNKGIHSYGKRFATRFTYLEWNYLKHIFPNRTVEQMEAIFLESFAGEFGTYPICNNRRGENHLDLKGIEIGDITFDWKFFG